MNKLTKSIIILAGVFALTGCGQIHPTGYQQLPTIKNEVKKHTDKPLKQAKVAVDKYGPTVKEKAKEYYEKGKNKLKEVENKSSESYTYEESDYDEAKFPNMYQVLGKAEIDESKFSTNYHYSELDSLGRSGQAYGLINYKAVMDSAGWRADFEPNSDPSGWNQSNGRSNNKKITITLPNGKTYTSYSFYNRSHLIADSLGGRSYKNNLITGTRQQNVGSHMGEKGGMQYIEEKVKNYVKNTKNNVYYEVTPVYNGDELLPRYVIVNAKSEDGVINEKVKVFNNASGYEINYSDGSFAKK